VSGSIRDRFRRYAELTYQEVQALASELKSMGSTGQRQAETNSAAQVALPGVKAPPTSKAERLRAKQQAKMDKTLWQQAELARRKRGEL
jgi:hypothetical protein